MLANSAIHRLVALATVGALMGPACTSGPDSDVDERVLEQVVDAVGTEDIELACPEPSEDPITCTVTIEGQEAPVAVEADAEGDAPEVQVGALVISRDELEADVTSEASELLESDASVTCGDTDRVVIPTGGSVECDVTGEDGTEGVAVVTVGPDGQPAVVELRAE